MCAVSEVWAWYVCVAACSGRVGGLGVMSIWELLLVCLRFFVVCARINTRHPDHLYTDCARMYPSYASLRTSVYTTFRVYIPGHCLRYSFTASPSGGGVRTRTPENLPTRDKATYNCPGGPTCQYGRTCTMCQHQYGQTCTMCQQVRTYAAYTPTGTGTCVNKSGHTLRTRPRAPKTRYRARRRGTGGTRRTCPESALGSC